MRCWSSIANVLTTNMLILVVVIYDDKDDGDVRAIAPFFARLKAAKLHRGLWNKINKEF